MRLVIAIVMGIIISACPPLRAEPQSYRLDAGGSRLSVLCRSTLHDFTIAPGAWQGALRVDLAAGEILQPSVVTVETGDLASGNAKRDKAMRRMFEAERFPTIAFSAARLVPEGGSQTGSGSYRLEGVLSIHGVERRLTIPVKAEAHGRELLVSGAFPVRLEDFGLKPPSVVGLIRVRNVVQIEFESRWMI